ncbi:uncharacterized protein LACBIDRAFT_327704 [Laccaria bicolor S238N-H82]|uniref:Predicted protein n=1 Tax=Laccaria bicolor (strain S238N-H82 / ATCC MYA-4686) TaxID=486041 RepID=B0DCL3_LACBS|nr:uncharacterized protein LACBIDRAFT_327704 [Laccaria bicolor S238N-H82]EDR07751.1 predicted protein [Laccaria bicolor S238N-H82]|eukprot:XP_001881540.1 predicted protein [Laccaria bicolor S238N-H82]
MPPLWKALVAQLASMGKGPGKRTNPWEMDENSVKRKKLTGGKKNGVTTDKPSKNASENVSAAQKQNIDVSGSDPTLRLSSVMNQGQSQQDCIDMFLGSFQCQIPVPHTADLMAPRYQSFQIEKPVSEFFTGTYPWDEKDQDADKEEAHSLDVEDEEIGEDAGKIDLRAIGKFEITHILFHEDLPEMKEIRDGKQRQAPTLDQARAALKDLKEILDPPRKTGAGHKDPSLDLFVRKKVQGMVSMLNFYTIPHSHTYGKWGASALQATVSMGRGRYCTRQLTALVRKFLDDHTFLPVNPYGDWNQSMLIDEDLSLDINLYLQEIRKDVSAKKVVSFLAQEEVKQKHGITKAISEWTAR